MTAKYLIRFDDVCPEMNWSVWDRIEKILSSRGVSPILAVVPENRDIELMCEAPKHDFWDRVRSWQSKGWSIGLHGYNHVYRSKDSGLIGINRFSEFAGLSRADQYNTLLRAVQKFTEEGVAPDLWVAPGHSFDDKTIASLLSLEIKFLSDGFYFRPVSRLGITWIPQQLWRFRKLPFGLWTVCFHANGFTNVDILDFEKSILTYERQIVSLKEVMQKIPARNIGISDRVFSSIWRSGILAKRW